MTEEFRFTEEEHRQIMAAIADAEKSTSGEIRLFIEDKCDADVLDRAAFVFHKLKMDQTKLRNGVLFYLAIRSHKFAILGDKGIHQKVGSDFWNAIKADMETHFKQSEFVTGLSKGIRMSGQALLEHFPYKSGDKNELPDDIVYGK